VERRDSEPPFEGGAQPVVEHPPEVPGGGTKTLQIVIIVIAVLAIIFGLAWLLTPLLH